MACERRTSACRARSGYRRFYSGVHGQPVAGTRDLHECDAVDSGVIGILNRRVCGAGSDAEYCVKNFLKSSDHTHADPAVRLAHVHKLDAQDPAFEDQLDALAREDAASEVRIAAVGRLDDAAKLSALVQDRADDVALMDAVTARLAERFDAGAVEDSVALACLNQDSARFAALVAARAEGADVRGQAFEHIDSEQDLLRVLEGARVHDARRVAAERLWTPTALRGALQLMRGRDKVVHRAVQQRLVAFNALESAERDAREAAASIADGMEQLAGSVWSPQHAGKRQALMDKWRSLDDSVREPESDRLNDALRRVDALLAERAAQATDGSSSYILPSALDPAASESSESASSVEQGAADVAVVPLDDATLAWVSRFEGVAPEAMSSALSEAVSLSDGAGSQSDAMSALQAHASAVAVLFDPPFTLAGSRPGPVQQRLNRIDALLDLSRVLPGVDGSELPWLPPLQAHRAELDTRLAQAQQESSDRLRATQRQFSMLMTLVKDGKWAPANSLFRRIEKKIGQMDAAEKRQVNDRLERARRQLAEMADWQDFAGRPKLEEVIARMETLISAELGPDARAKAVRELQSEWKSLGSSRASSELWPRFKQASDAAYEPCKVEFESRAKDRDAKKAERLAALETLEATPIVPSEGEELDYRALQSTVSRARQTWSRTRVRDRKPDKSLEARFTAALKPAEELLSVEYERNEAVRQELVDKMAALAEGEITQHSANQAKRLQSAWKLVGITRRKQDQVLWEAFNGHAKKVFGSRRDAAKAENRSALAHVYRGREIVDELRKLGKRLPVDDAAVQALSTEFDALPEFPERDKKGLIRAFREAMDSVSRQREAGAKRRQAASHDEARRLVELCQRIERMLESPESSGENSLTLADDVRDAWDNASDVSAPRELAARLLERRDAAIAHLEAGSQPDWDAAEEARRDLLIRMEVTAGIDTPSEDSSRRMRYQLEHLQEGMTSAAVTDKRTTLQALERDWLSMAPVRAAVSDSLESRYLKAVGR